MAKPELDPATRRKNRALALTLVAVMFGVVVWALLFLREHGFNLGGGH